MRAKVLIVGTDLPLLESRYLILRKQYDVAVARPDTALEHLRTDKFDLLLVCQSTPREQASSMIRAVHEEFRHVWLVRLLAVDEDPIEKPVAHKIFTVNYRPEVWVEAVNNLLQEQ